LDYPYAGCFLSLRGQLQRPFWNTISGMGLGKTRNMSFHEMVQKLLNFVATHAFEFAGLLVSVAALVYAALAFRAANQAIHLAKASNMAVLRLKVQDELSAAERSFHKLQESCRDTRSQWERHLKKHYPSLGRAFSPPEETKHIAELEQAGRRLLQELKDTVPHNPMSEAAETEVFVKRAHAAAMQIERLAFDLEAPKPFERVTM
jgi:hypothetical protein